MKRKIGLAVGIVCLLLASIAVYEIMVMAGFFQNKDTDAGKKFSSTEQTHKKNAPEDNNVGAEKVTLAWDIVQEATSYNVYWGNSKGFSKRDGKKISTELVEFTKNYFSERNINVNIEFSW